MCFEVSVHRKYMFHCKVSPYFSNYMLGSQKLKMRSKLSEWNCEEIFVPTNVCFLLWSIKWRCKQINKEKAFFVTQISFEGMSVCRKCKHHPQRSLFCFLFMESYWLFTSFKVHLHVPIWALLILGTHKFSGSNSS